MGQVTLFSMLRRRARVAYRKGKYAIDQIRRIFRGIQVGYLSCLFKREFTPGDVTIDVGKAGDPVFSSVVALQEYRAAGL
jgi:hypothetical protein